MVSAPPLLARPSPLTLIQRIINYINPPWCISFNNIRAPNMSSLISQENKELLWGILAEEGIFDGIPTSVTPQEVKHVFEQILKNLSANIPAIHAGRLKELHHAKQQAIADEDYDAAKKIRATIGEMEAVVPRLEKLEQRKQQAVQAEDFEAAKQLKIEIDRVRSTAFSLKELNKIALQSLVVNIPKIANDISASKTGSSGGGGGGGGVSPFFPSRGNNNNNNNNNNPAAIALPTPQVREIYNAEDFHSRKREEIETKLREKEAEMRSYFEVPRPQEIDFSDVPRDSQTKTKPTTKKNHGGGGGGGEEDDDNDSPLADNSDDIEKIIAERIAARQRDLDEITERMKATNPPPPNQAQASSSSQPTVYSTNDLDVPAPPPMPVPMPVPAPLSVDAVNNNNSARKVRFQEDTDDNPILLKLKRKPTVE